MSDQGNRLSADRDVRDEARALLTERFNRLKTGLEERGLGQRMADEAAVRARAVATEAIEVANDSRGVVIGTLAVLAAWLLRKPIMNKARAMLPGVQETWLRASDSLKAQFAKETRHE